MAKTVKVGGAPKPEKVKKGRSTYDFKSAKIVQDGKLVSAVNEKGLLIGAPVTIANEKDAANPIQIGFNPAKNKPILKKDFADEAAYLDFQAYLAEWRANKFLGLAKERKDRAEKLRKYGDVKTRSKAKKLERMREQVLKLQAELAADGVKVD